MSGGFGGTEKRGMITLENGETGVVLNAEAIPWDDELEGDLLLPITTNSCAIVLATDVIDPFASALLKAPWPGASGTFPYVLVKISWKRLDVNIQYAADAREFAAAVRRAGFIWAVPEGADPDPAVGEDGSFAVRFADFTWWNKIDGAWIPKGSVNDIDVSNALAAASSASASASDAAASQETASFEAAAAITARADTVIARAGALASEQTTAQWLALARQWADNDSGVEVLGYPGRLSAKAWATQTVSAMRETLAYLIGGGILGVFDFGSDAPVGSDFDAGKDQTLVTFVQFDFGLPTSSNVVSFAGLQGQADRGIYFTAPLVLALYTLSAFGRQLSAVANAGAALALIGAEASANKTIANGYPSLDATGKIPAAQLPASVVGDVQFQSTWNAATNTPAIPAASSANKGQYYVVATAGTTNIGGIVDWAIGDWLVSSGAVWQKIDNTDSVTSVAGLLGVITGPALKTALALVVGDVSGAAPLASPTFTGDPKAPTPAPGDNDTSVSTTAYVQASRDFGI